jgi:hypothetical protein
LEKEFHRVLVKPTEEEPVTKKESERVLTNDTPEWSPMTPIREVNENSTAVEDGLKTPENGDSCSSLNNSSKQASASSSSGLPPLPSLLSPTFFTSLIVALLKPFPSGLLLHSITDLNVPLQLPLHLHNPDYNESARIDPADSARRRELGKFLEKQAEGGSEGRLMSRSPYRSNASHISVEGYTEKEMKELRECTFKQSISQKSVVLAIKKRNEEMQKVENEEGERKKESEDRHKVSGLKQAKDSKRMKVTRSVNTSRIQRPTASSLLHVVERKTDSGKKTFQPHSPSKEKVVKNDDKNENGIKSKNVRSITSLAYAEKKQPLDLSKDAKASEADVEVTEEILQQVCCVLVFW